MNPLATLCKLKSSGFDGGGDEGGLCNLSQVRVLFCYFCSCSCSCLRLVVILFASCLRFCLCSCFHSCSCFFQIMCQKICLNFVSNYVWGQFGLLEEFRGLGFSRLLNLFAYFPIKQIS